MRVTIARKAALVVLGAPFVSQAVQVAGANAVSVQITVETNTNSDDLEIGVQESNDLGNWTAVGATEVTNAIGAFTFERSDIAGRFIRVMCSAPFGFGSDRIVFTALVETKNL